MLIEDDVQIRRFVTAALDNERFQVYCAESGDQGFNRNGTRKPDLVMLDLGLPDSHRIQVNYRASKKRWQSSCPKAIF